MYASTIAATFGLLASAALAAPAPQITSGPNAPYPPKNLYVVKNFKASTGRMSDLSTYSMDITLNQNGYTPYTTTCTGTQSTQPVLTYLNDTACEDSAVVISWTTVKPSEEQPGAHYQLNIKDTDGYVGSKTWKWDIVQQDGDQEYPTYYVDAAETFEVPRRQSSQV